MVLDENDIKYIANGRVSKREGKKVSYASYAGMAMIGIGLYFLTGFLTYLVVGIGVAIVFYYLFYHLSGKQKAYHLTLLKEWRGERDLQNAKDRPNCV